MSVLPTLTYKFAESPIAANSQIATLRDAGKECWDFVQLEDGRIGCQQYVYGEELGWTRYIKAPDIRPGSPLAAFKGGRHHSARLYYQDVSGHIREMVEHDEDWSPSSAKLPKMMEGSSLTVTNWDALDHVRLYYQDETGRICEHCCDMGRWNAGGVLNPNPSPPRKLAAVGYRDFNQVLTLCVYFIEPEGSRDRKPEVHLYKYTSKTGKWQLIADYYMGLPTAPSGLGVAEWQGNAAKHSSRYTNIVFYQVRQYSGAEQIKYSALTFTREASFNFSNWETHYLRYQPYLKPWQEVPMTAMFMDECGYRFVCIDADRNVFMEMLRA